jgi:hypothetical protein
LLVERFAQTASTSAGRRREQNRAASRRFRQRGKEKAECIDATKVRIFDLLQITLDLQDEKAKLMKALMAYKKNSIECTVLLSRTTVQRFVLVLVLVQSFVLSLVQIFAPTFMNAGSKL